jgi:hypothetical protein
MTEWLKGCEVCNTGLCNRFNELIQSGLSQRQAAERMEKEQQEQIGNVVYSADALRQRYQFHTGKSSAPDSGRVSPISKTPPPPEVIEAIINGEITLKEILNYLREALERRFGNPTLRMRVNAMEGKHHA